MAQTRKNGRRGGVKRGNSRPNVTLNKPIKCSGVGVKKIARKHSVKRKKKSSSGKKTVKRAQSGGLWGTVGRQLDFERNTAPGALKKLGTLGWQVGRTTNQYLTRGVFPDLIYINNLVRAIALRVGLTPNMIEVFGARAKSGVPKTIHKIRTKKPELFEEFIKLGTLQQIPEGYLEKNERLNEYTKQLEGELTAVEQTSRDNVNLKQLEGGVDAAEGDAAEGLGSSTGGGIRRKVIDTILKPYRGLMRQAAVDLVNTNNLVRLIAYQLGMSPDMISEIAGYHNDPEGKHGFPKTYYKDKNKVFRELFDNLPRVGAPDKDGKINKDGCYNHGKINIADSHGEQSDSVMKEVRHNRKIQKLKEQKLNDINSYKEKYPEKSDEELE